MTATMSRQTIAMFDFRSDIKARLLKCKNHTRLSVVYSKKYELLIGCQREGENTGPHATLLIPALLFYRVQRGSEDGS
jgi:hypothetical protein